MMSPQTNRLQAELAELRKELRADDKLRAKLSKILDDTAIALHGGSVTNVLWSWHDLAELATQQRKTLEAAMHALRSYQYGNAATELAKEAADECDMVLNKPPPRQRREQ